MIKWTFHFEGKSAESRIATLEEDHEIIKLVRSKSKKILHIRGHPMDLYINMKFVSCATREVIEKEENNKTINEPDAA